MQLSDGVNGITKGLSKVKRQKKMDSCLYQSEGHQFIIPTKDEILRN